MEFNNPQHKSFLWHLTAHCVLRTVSGIEHHVSDHLLFSIEGCCYKNQACLFPTLHDDCGWCGCSCNHGVYSGYYGQYGNCLSYTVGMLWGDWNVCVIETPRSSLDKRRIFRKPTRPSLPLRKAPPLSPALSPQERGRKSPYSVLGTATL